MESVDETGFGAGNPIGRKFVARELTDSAGTFVRTGGLEIKREFRGTAFEQSLFDFWRE
jgi:hypothetical protein